MPSEKQIEAAADQISEGLGAFLRKFCDSEASKRARYYLHEMPKDEWNQMALMLATEALIAAEQAEPAPAARSGVVKPLDEDDYEEIISAATNNMRKASSGIRGQMVTAQDSLDWWVMKETERRILSALRALEAQEGK